MRQLQICAALLLGLIAASAAAQSGSTSERRFTLPDHGNLVMQVPRNWKDHIRQPPNRLPPTIALGPRSGRPFVILVTAVWPTTKMRPPQSREQLRAAVEQGAQGVKAQSVEKELSVVEFQGRTGSGFYYSATDRAPKPGEYKFVTQGIVRVGELTVTFTILTNDGQEAVVDHALDALKSAVQERV